MAEVYGIERIHEIAERLDLPAWWVKYVIVEHFPCRRYAESGELWAFDFNTLSENNIQGNSSGSRSEFNMKKSPKIQ